MHAVPTPRAHTPSVPSQPGDRACLAALATDLNLEALLAVTAAGGIAAPLNWRWGAGEAAGAAALVGARVLLADAACLRFALALAAARPGAVTTLVLLGPPADYSQAELAAAPQGLSLAFAESLMAGCPGAGPGLRAAPGGAALIVYTSGAGCSLRACWCTRRCWLLRSVAAQDCWGSFGFRRAMQPLTGLLSLSAALQAPPAHPRAWRCRTTPCTPSAWPSCSWCAGHEAGGLRVRLSNTASTCTCIAGSCMGPNHGVRAPSRRRRHPNPRWPT